MLYESGKDLCWVESSNISVFPCPGRGNITTANKINIPLDLEARLATERNYINMTANNGYKKSFIQLEVDTEGNKKLKELVLNGYRFTFTDGYYLEDFLNAGTFPTGTAEIYAVIKTEETNLVQSNDISATTPVLRSLIVNGTSLDTLTNGESYFYGLAFTTNPDDPDNIDLNTGNTQKKYSLQIIKNGEFNLEALLPSIEHGETENSVKMGSVQVDKLSLGAGDSELKVPALYVEKQTDNTYQLQFSYSAGNSN